MFIALSEQEFITEFTPQARVVVEDCGHSLTQIVYQVPESCVVL